MSRVNSVQEIFENINEGFQPDKAEGVNAIFQFNLSGDNGGVYWIRVYDKQMEVNEGEHEAPTLIINSSADDYIALVNGELNPMMAFMQGKLKIDGSMGQAMKLASVLG